MKPVKNEKFTTLDIGDFCYRKHEVCRTYRIYRVATILHCQQNCSQCMSQNHLYGLNRFIKNPGKVLQTFCPGYGIDDWVLLNLEDPTVCDRVKPETLTRIREYKAKRGTK